MVSLAKYIITHSTVPNCSHYGRWFKMGDGTIVESKMADKVPPFNVTYSINRGYEVVYDEDGDDTPCWSLEGRSLYYEKYNPLSMRRMLHDDNSDIGGKDPNKMDVLDVVEMKWYKRIRGRVVSRITEEYLYKILPQHFTKEYFAIAVKLDLGIYACRKNIDKPFRIRYGLTSHHEKKYRYVKRGRRVKGRNSV